MQVAGDLAVGVGEREPGEPALGHQPLDVGRRGSDVQGDQLVQRDRDVAGDPVAELQGAGHQPVLVALEQPLAVALGHDVLHLLGGERGRELVLGLDAERADQPLGDALHQPDHAAAAPG